jgi:hypothetical protein
VYGLIDGRRVTNAQVFGIGNGGAYVRFSQPIRVTGCGTKRIEVAADFTPNVPSDSQHRIVIARAEDVYSNVKVQGLFPITSSNFQIASVRSGVVMLTYQPIAYGSVAIGGTETIVGSFALSADDREDHTLERLTLEQIGSAADGDVRNIRIRLGNQYVTNALPQADDGVATLVFDPPETIRAGNHVAFDIVADVVSGAGKRVRFRVTEPSDVFVVGTLYGSGVSKQRYGSRVVLPVMSNVLPADTEIITRVEETESETPDSGEEDADTEHNETNADGATESMTITNANPDADGTQVPIGTDVTIAAFTLADAAITLSDIVFSIESDNVTFAENSFAVFSVSDPSEAIPCTETATLGNFLVQCSSADNPIVDMTIDNGGSITLALRSDISANRIDVAKSLSLQVFLSDLSDVTQRSNGIPGDGKIPSTLYQM